MEKINGNKKNKIKINNKKLEKINGNKKNKIKTRGWSGKKYMKTRKKEK